MKTRDGNDKAKQLESVDLSLVAAPLVKDPSLSRCLALSFPSLVFTSRDIILHSKCRFSRVPRVIHGVLAQYLVLSEISYSCVNYFDLEILIFSTIIIT